MSEAQARRSAHQARDRAADLLVVGDVRRLRVGRQHLRVEGEDRQRATLLPLIVIPLSLVALTGVPASKSQRSSVMNAAVKV